MTWDNLLTPYDGRQRKLTNSDSTGKAGYTHIYHCPADPNNTHGLRSYSMIRGTGYAPDGTGNQWGVTTVVYIGGDEVYVSVKLTRISEPSSVFMITDRFGGGNNWLGSDACAVIDNPDNQITTKTGHVEGLCNYLYIDSHVASIKPIDTIKPGGTLTCPKGLWTRTNEK